jgi:hypothetical protein
MRRRSAVGLRSVFGNLAFNNCPAGLIQFKLLSDRVEVL